jgi:hypothetical protein
MIAAAAVARVIRDNDVSFRAGYEDRLAWRDRQVLSDPDRQLAYDLGWELSDGYASSPLARRLADQAADERARLRAEIAAEYARAMGVAA